MKTHIALGFGLLLSLAAGAVHAAEQQAEQQPRVFFSSENSWGGVRFEELVDVPISAGKSGYMLLVLSPHEQAVFSNGKLIRYLCIGGEFQGLDRQCRAQTSPPASLIASFAFFGDEKNREEGMAVRILDEEYFELRPYSMRPSRGYKLTHVDGKPYDISYNPETFKILISKGK